LINRLCQKGYLLTFAVLRTTKARFGPFSARRLANER